MSVWRILQGGLWAYSQPSLQDTHCVCMAYLTGKFCLGSCMITQCICMGVFAAAWQAAGAAWQLLLAGLRAQWSLMEWETVSERLFPPCQTHTACVWRVSYEAGVCDMLRTVHI